MGVTSFKTWVEDSHTEYIGNNNYHTTSKPMYDNLVIEEICDKEKFSRYLKIQREGKSDYYTFCKNFAGNTR